MDLLKQLEAWSEVKKELDALEEIVIGFREDARDAIREHNKEYGDSKILTIRVIDERPESMSMRFETVNEHGIIGVWDARLLGVKDTDDPKTTVSGEDSVHVEDGYTVTHDFVNKVSTVVKADECCDGHGDAPTDKPETPEADEPEIEHECKVCHRGIIDINGECTYCGRPDKPELKPCPFCGGEDIRAYIGVAPEDWIECHDCGGRTRMTNNGAIATTAWNSRPIEYRLKAENEQLKKERVSSAYYDEVVELRAENERLKKEPPWEDRVLRGTTFRKLEADLAEAKEEIEMLGTEVDRWIEYGDKHEDYEQLLDQKPPPNKPESELPICEKCGEEFCGDGTSKLCFTCQPEKPYKRVHVPKGEER